MSQAVYAIDAKKKRALAEDSLSRQPLVSVEAALGEIFPGTQRWSPKPAAEDAQEALAFLVRFDAERRRPDDTDQLEALWGMLSRNHLQSSATCSLFFHWAGPEWLLTHALHGGRYSWDPSRQTLVTEPVVLSNWDLYRTLAFLLDHAPVLRARLVSAVRDTKLPLSDRSRAASLVEDVAWAGELAEEWMAKGTSRVESWNNCMLLGLIDDPDRFERFVASFGDQIRYVGRSARLGRALDQLPAPVVEKVVVGLLDRGVKEKWKASEVEPWAKLLAHVRSEEAARAIAQWVGEKSVAKVATDYFRTHPDLAPAALGSLLKAKGKAGPIAKAILESLARNVGKNAAPDEAESGKADKKASKATSKASKASSKASKADTKVSKSDTTGGTNEAGSATATSLPAVLVEPPWRSKSLRQRPRLALTLLVDAERFEPRVTAHTPRPDADRSPERDAKMLGGTPPAKIYEGSIFRLTDAVALEAVRDREAINAWSLDGIVHWLGEPVIPLAIRSIARHLAQAHWLLPRAESSRLALPCARIALKRSGGSERVACRAWMQAHPTLAALGLVPAALGEDELDADVASRTLRMLTRGGHAETVLAAASRYGDAAREAIEAVLAASPYDRYPAKLPQKAKWALPSQIGTLELADGTRLTEEHGTAFVQMLQFGATGDPYPGATDTIALATKASREALSKALFAEYLLAGSPPSHAWVIAAVTLLAPESSIALLAGQMRAWAADGKVSLLHDSLEALAAIGSDEALVVVYDAGQRSRYDDTRDKVRELLEAVARERDVTYEVLEDMLVPELGLENGSVALELGARTLSVRLGDHLEAVLTDEAGNVLASFPRKGKSDDDGKYDAAKARYAALLETSEAVGKGQILRLERALRSQRSWSVRELRTLVLPQPLVRHLARRLVWQVVGGDVLFRVAEDLSLADANDETLAWPADDTRVVLAHPITAKGVRAFQSWVDDYRVIQPFAQVGREVYVLEAAEQSASRIERAVGRKAPYLSVLALTLGMGWKPIPPGNHGIDAVTREIIASDGATLVARLAISPGLLFGAAKGRPEQTIGALSLETEAKEAVPFDRLDALSVSELLRDAMLL